MKKEFIIKMLEGRLNLIEKTEGLKEIVDTVDEALEEIREEILKEKGIYVG